MGAYLVAGMGIGAWQSNLGSAFFYWADCAKKGVWDGFWVRAGRDRGI
jgi:hypothetical protein